MNEKQSGVKTKAYLGIYGFNLPLANPDIRLGGHINPDIRLGGNFMCFPMSQVYFFVKGANIYSQTGWGPRPNSPRNHGSATAPNESQKCWPIKITTKFNEPQI